MYGFPIMGSIDTSTYKCECECECECERGRFCLICDCSRWLDRPTYDVALLYQPSGKGRYQLGSCLEREFERTHIRFRGATLRLHPIAGHGLGEPLCLTRDLDHHRCLDRLDDARQLVHQHRHLDRFACVVERLPHSTNRINQTSIATREVLSLQFIGNQPTLESPTVVVSMPSIDLTKNTRTRTSVP